MAGVCTEVHKSLAPHLAPGSLPTLFELQKAVIKVGCRMLWAEGFGQATSALYGRRHARDWQQQMSAEAVVYFLHAARESYVMLCSSCMGYVTFRNYWAAPL
jgi:hypothetical protein